MNIAATVTIRTTKNSRKLFILRHHETIEVEEFGTGLPGSGIGGWIISVCVCTLGLK